MNANPPPPSPEHKAPLLVESNDYEQYLLHSRSEILYVLKSLIERVCQVTVFFGENNLILTSVIEADETGMVLDFGASGEMNRKAQEAKKLFCVTNLDKVKVQFILHGMTKIDYQGRPAFRAELPESLLRLQRREYYRLTMPITRPLKCLLPLPQADGSIRSREVDVVDISGGGLAMISPPDDVPLEEGMEIPGSSVELPEIGTIAATLNIRTLFEITLRNGARLRRSGCQFINLPGPMQTLIQRYIIKTERERKARESGFG
ncbi:hypothetical protein B9N43_08835 [Denitratisoma sp. DHT3]|uniref:flagellar brake protein n=1 Tax=Denitratisoma sp. DHT3 TaxID=1981880 RepID=UPI0011984199|nr:flagellar brake protein [Denitratisoma sp. DHT3]QDX81337.1 hypothetical protein B9N43_08835 [Denitratisoma sp. DHT3]